MTYATIDALRSGLGAPELGPEYTAKMMHPVPTAQTVDREAFICRQAASKRVLDIGASGALHVALVGVAARVAGIDRSYAEGVTGLDLDDVTIPTLPVDGPFDLVVIGEVLEHLSNPGFLLTRLRRQLPGVPIIVTVPNAFSSAGAKHLTRGVENVHRDHVAWYSPTTIATLLERAGYVTGALYYYNGEGPRAEGLIVCAE
jgi:2-polyprenyl-3-methyl-5-hydroxy-6-metoxy-1,4-benzoquinol methylase